MKRARLRDLGFGVGRLPTGPLNAITDVGGVREAIGDAGRCVRANDPQALGTACLELLGDPALRRSLGRVGRQRVETMFDLDAMLRAHRRLYDELSGPFRTVPLDAPGQTIDLREPAPDRLHTT